MSIYLLYRHDPHQNRLHKGERKQEDIKREWQGKPVKHLTEESNSRNAADEGWEEGGVCIIWNLELLTPLCVLGKAAGK